VDQWTQMMDENKQNILELFYNDKKRWGYTFQTCALLTRHKNMQDMMTRLQEATTPQVIITERSILTDKYIFAEMLYHTGYITCLEWELYNNMFDTISQNQCIDGIIYVSTSAATSKERIALRGRPEEDSISITYLDDLDKQHKKWLSTSLIPVCTVSTEPGNSLDTTMKQINEFITSLQ
jgi:deoxyadenosine/deoxycytidine kinase